MCEDMKGSQMSAKSEIRFWEVSVLEGMVVQLGLCLGEPPWEAPTPSLATNLKPYPSALPPCPPLVAKAKAKVLR